MHFSFRHSGPRPERRAQEERGQAAWGRDVGGVKGRGLSGRLKRTGLALGQRFVAPRFSEKALGTEIRAFLSEMKPPHRTEKYRTTAIHTGVVCSHH